MKHIHITLEDSEFESITEVKGDLTWRELIMTLIDKEVKRER
jgi:hypothetical protein